MPTASSHLKSHSVSAYTTAATGATSKTATGKNNAPKYYGKIIVIKRNGQDSASFELSDPNYLFGRAERCDIRIQLATIGEEHCRIFPEPGLGRFAMIQNLSSVGVTVNGVLIQDHKEHVLRCGDVITIVERSFRYENPFWTEAVEEAEDVVMEEAVNVQTPVKAAVQQSPAKQGTPAKSIHNSPAKQATPHKAMSPVKQSTPAKSVASPSKQQTPTKTTMSPAKQAPSTPKLSSPKPQMTPTKSQTPVKVGTPVREQMSITPVKSNTPRISTPRQDVSATQMTVSQETPAVTQQSTPTAFAVTAAAQTEYQPPQSPAKFDVVMRTPVKTPTNVKVPESVTPVSQTKDIGKILPDSRSPTGYITTPTQPQQQPQQQVTPQTERSAKSVGSAGYSAIMSKSGEKSAETENIVPHQSPLRGVIDHEITASPRLSPRIKLLSTAHTDDIVMSSPSAAKVAHLEDELIAYPDQSATTADIDMLDSTVVPVADIEMTTAAVEEQHEQQQEPEEATSPMVMETSEATGYEPSEQQDSLAQAPQPMEIEAAAGEEEAVEAAPTITEPSVEEAVAIAEPVEAMTLEAVTVEPVETMTVGAVTVEEPVETVTVEVEAASIQEAVEAAIEEVAVETVIVEEPQPVQEIVVEQSEIVEQEEPEIVEPEEQPVEHDPTTMESTEPVETQTEVVELPKDAEMITESTQSITADISEQTRGTEEQPEQIVEQPDIEMSEATAIMITEEQQFAEQQFEIPIAGAETMMETPQTVDGQDAQTEPAEQVFEEITEKIETVPVVEEQVQEVNYNETENTAVVEEQPKVEQVETEAPLTPRRSSRLQQKASSTHSTPSKLSEGQMTASVVLSATRRSTRKTPAAPAPTPTLETTDTATRKSTRTPKIELSSDVKKKAMSTGGKRGGRTTATDDHEEQNDNSPSIQATRRSTRRKQDTEADAEDKENDNVPSDNTTKKPAARATKRSAELQSEPEMPAVRKSARTTRAK